MGVHEFFTTIEENDVIGLVDDLASKAGTPYYGPVPSGATNPVINHNLHTKDVDVTVYRVNDGQQVGVPSTRVDIDNVQLLFSAAPTGGQYRVTVSAGTGFGGTGGGGGGGGGAPDPHAATHASDGTDPVSPASIGAALSSHSHGSTYAPLVHASQHASGGADPITPASIAAATQVHSHSGTDLTSGVIGIGRLPTGTAHTTVAFGDHTHTAGGVAPHAGTHALGGSDPLSPEDIGGAAANHNHQGRIIPAGGTQGQALVKASDNDYDTTWGAGGGGGGGTIGPTAIKPFPPILITKTNVNYTATTDPGHTHFVFHYRIDASLGTHFRIDYVKLTNSFLDETPVVDIVNPTYGQSLLVEYRNMTTAFLDLIPPQFNNDGVTYPGIVNTHFDFGSTLMEGVYPGYGAYYSFIYDERTTSGVGSWRLLSQNVGFKN